MNYTERYTRTAIAIHWIAAVLIIGNLCWGVFMIAQPFSPEKLKYYSWHKWTGVTIFLVVALRLLWRLGHRPPPLPASMPRWETLAAHFSHALLYVLFFAAPLSGWLYSSAAGFQTVWFGVVPIPDLVGKNKELADVLQEVHKWVVITLALTITVHIAAAIKHHRHDRDDVLTRMLPFLRPPAPPPSPPNP